MQMKYITNREHKQILKIAFKLYHNRNLFTSDSALSAPDFEPLLLGAAVVLLFATG